MANTQRPKWTEEMIEKLHYLKNQRWKTKDIAAGMGLTMTTVNKAWGRYGPAGEGHPPDGSQESPPGPARSITLGQIIDKYDTRKAIFRELGKIPKGEFMEQADLCRSASGADRLRFNRCLEIHAAEFAPYRIKIRIGESADGRWYWASPEDIAKAKSEVEEYL
jgi:hypothetical protein